MMNGYILGSILALISFTGLAHAQPALGSPVAGENKVDPTYGQYAPAVYSTERRLENSPKPNYPFLNLVARTILLPIRAASGHVMPPPCAEESVPTREDVGRMIADGGYSPAEISAAKIKIDEGKASARRAAVRYLATIDCQYYPEAETGLITALRADRSEIVRYEAAAALANCQRLPDNVLEALNMTALGLELDGNPAETSERVRGAARASLCRCLARGLCLPPLAHEVALARSWLAPEPDGIQSTAYQTPAPISAPTPVAPPSSQKDREQAETISIQSKQAAPVTESRPFAQFFLKLLPGREPPQDTRTNIDPRLRGLTPLCAEPNVAIPSPRFNPVPAAPTSPYNYQE